MIDEAAAHLFTCLRRMDGEASRPAGHKGLEYPTGLYWYNGHSGERGTEVAWTRRVPSLLREAPGYSCDREVRYRGTSKKCDLVIGLPDGKRLWVEVKGSWKEWWGRRGSLGMFRSLLLYPHETDVGRTHAAA